MPVPIAEEPTRQAAERKAQGRRFWKASATIVAVFGVLACLLGASLLPSLLVHYQLQAAKKYLFRRDYENAKASLDHIRRMQPHNGLASFYLARLYRRLDNEQQFSRFLEEAQRRGVPWDRAQREWQLWNAQQGDLALVEPYVGKFLVLPPEEIPDVCEAFSRGFLLTFRLADAKRMLEIWEQQAPDDGMLYQVKGDVYAAEQAWSQAVEAYRRAARLLPRDIDCTIKLAEALLEAEQWPEAAEWFGRAMDTNTTRPRAVRGLIRCHLLLGQDEAAAELLDQWTKEYSVDGDDRRLAARVELRRQRPHDALRWLEPLLERWPADVEAHQLRLAALEQLGRLSESDRSQAVIESGKALLANIVNMQRTAYEEPRNVRLRLHIGQLLVDRQSRDQGLRWLEAAALMDPYLREAREKLIETYTKLGRTDRAAHHQQLLDAGNRGAL